MTLQYTLDENDFLQHQLFVASKSERIKTQRTKTWLIYSGAMFLLSLLFYQSHNKLWTYYFLASGFISLCFYPFYQSWYYKRYYQKFVAESKKNKFGQVANIKFSGDHIESNDITGESKINLSALENITETSGYFYLKMKTGGHLIIPKNKVDNIEVVRNEMKRICNQLSIDFADELNWKWK